MFEQYFGKWHLIHAYLRTKISPCPTVFCDVLVWRGLLLRQRLLAGIFELFKAKEWGEGTRVIKSLYSSFTSIASIHSPNSPEWKERVDHTAWRVCPTAEAMVLTMALAVSRADSSCSLQRIRWGACCCRAPLVPSMKDALPAQWKFLSSPRAQKSSHMFLLIRLYHLPLRGGWGSARGCLSHTRTWGWEEFEDSGQHCLQTQVPIFRSAPWGIPAPPTIGQPADHSCSESVRWGHLSPWYCYAWHLKSYAQPRRHPQLWEPKSHQSVVGTGRHQRGLLGPLVVDQRSRRERWKRRGEEGNSCVLDLNGLQDRSAPSDGRQQGKWESCEENTKFLLAGAYSSWKQPPRP